MSGFDKFKKAATADDDAGKLPFTAHLEELRKRLIRSLIALLVGFFISFGYSQELLTIILAPLKEAMPPGGAITIHEVTEGFVTKLKISMWGGFFIACPVIFYQLWSFISPGLNIKEKKYVVPFVLVTTAFFFAGASFCYFVVIPVGLKFLLGMESLGADIKPYIPIGSYFKFSTDFSLAFGLIFELPVAAFILSKVGVINYRLLIKWHGMAIIGIAVVAAIMTPTPDLLSMLLMGGPLYLLYLVSIAVAWVFGPKTPPDDDGEE